MPIKKNNYKNKLYLIVSPIYVIDNADLKSHCSFYSSKWLNLCLTYIYFIKQIIIIYNLENLLPVFNLFKVLVCASNSAFSLTIVNNGSKNILLVHFGNV